MKLHPVLQKIAALLAFAAVTAVLLAACDFLLTDDVHSYSRVMLQELYDQSRELDTLFLGASHCYRSVDPAQVDARLGTHSFNAGTSQQQPDGSYYLLKELTGRSDLDTVYLEMFYVGYSNEGSSQVPLACYLITDYLDPLSPNRYAYLMEMGGPAAFADLLMPARHAIGEPGELPALWKAKLSDGYAPGNYSYVTYPDEGEAYQGRGFVYTRGTPRYGFDTVLNVNADAPLTDFAWTYLEKIADLCEENGIRLVLFTAPLPSAYADSTANYQSYLNAVQSFADRRGLSFWDFTLYREIIVNFEDFCDAHHLNGQGARKFTDALCSVIEAEAAGEAVQDRFFPTLEEKLAACPDDTVYH